jgi:hypothetical protein
VLATMSARSDTYILRPGHAASDLEGEVRQAALNLVLSANQEGSRPEITVSDHASEANVNWARQLPVRLASCSAEFTPDTLPSIENGQGILFTSLEIA